MQLPVENSTRELPVRVPDSETSPVALSSGFVSPSEFLSPVSHVKHSTSTLSKTDSMVTSQAPSEYSRQIDTPPIEEPEFTRALTSIRQFLRQRSTYDVFPISSRIIILDTELLVKRSLTILTANGIVSAPLWDSRKSSFAGMLSVADYINVIQYYLQNPDAFKEVDNFRLSSLRDVERSIGAQPIETIYAEPLQELYSACVQMVESRARRIPLVDYDDQTARMVVISVLTQYRILKFAVINTHRSTLEALSIPIRQLGIGTWVEDGVQTARWDTPVVECIQTLVAKNISSIPIVSDSDQIINVFESVDVISLIKGGNYEDLNLGVGEALTKREAQYSGIYTCSPQDRLQTILEIIRDHRVHRFVIVDERNRLQGVLALSDIMSYLLYHGAKDDPPMPSRTARA